MTMTLFLQSILAGLTNGFVYGLIGLGIAVVFRGARIINAMQGDFALLGSVVAYVALTRLGVPMLPAFLAGVLAGGVLGLLVERLLIRPTEKRAAWRLPLPGTSSRQAPPAAPQIIPDPGKTAQTPSIG